MMAEVKPLSRSEREAQIKDKAGWVITVIALYPITKKIHKSAFLPRKYVFSFLTFLSIYMFYRYVSHIYSFTSINKFSSVKLLDILFFAPLIPLILFLLNNLNHN